MPLLEETGYMPTEKYAMAPEIFEHAQRIGQHYDLYAPPASRRRSRTCAGTKAPDRWIVATDRNDAFRARYVVHFERADEPPELPGVPESSLKGHSFHTSRWDYEYTGGTTPANLPQLKDKRVGIIGTGATSSGRSHLGEAASTCTSSSAHRSVDARNNRPTDPEWVKTLTPGWQAAAGQLQRARESAVSRG